jgi:ferritin-like metal-binding protein YciE
MSDQKKAMQDRMDILQKYVGDMIAVEEHIGDAVKRQVEDKQVYEHNQEVSRIINQIAQITERHKQHLQDHLKAMGGDKGKGLQKVAAGALGAVAGMYDKIRNDKVSKMLRDDYTALSLAAVSYTMLHTTGLALQDQATADLALRHLDDYTQVVMDISEIVPKAVVEDLRSDTPIMNESSAQQAITNTQRTWKPDNGVTTQTPTSRPI